MLDLSFKYKELINKLHKEAPFTPEISLILGSGLGDFAESVKIVKSVSTADLPGYPLSTIVGHAGKILFCKYEGKDLLIFKGRIHFYEGYHISDCVLPVFISYKLNCKKVFITNAAGGINKNFNPGDLMLINSFNSINIKNELTRLIGIANEKGRNNFLKFPSEYLVKKIKEAAEKEDINLQEGVYWFTKGPSYETPAEIKMMGRFGGDAVGMSSAHEAIFAAYLGLETAAVSLITNFAAGISPNKLSHSEVTETANLAKDKFERLVKRMITLI